MTSDEKILEMLSRIEKDIADIKATQAEHTDILQDLTVGVNELIEWAEEAQIEVKIPFGKVKAN